MNTYPVAAETKPNRRQFLLYGAAGGFVALLGGSVVVPFVVGIIDGDVESIVALGEDWVRELRFITLLALQFALFLGLPVGGIVGLITGSIWKTNKAAVIGGIIMGLILIPVSIVQLLWMLFGGPSLLFNQ